MTTRLRTYLLLPATVALLGADFTRAETTLFELKFPYAEGFTNLDYQQGLGQGVGDFDNNKDKNDLATGYKFLTPKDETYRSDTNVTEKGPQLIARSAVAHLDVGEESKLEPPRLGGHGFTVSDIRLEGINTTKGTVTDNMGHTHWLLFPKENFPDGTEPLTLDGGTNLTLEAVRPETAEIRFLVKSGDKYFVSEVLEGDDVLELSAAGDAEWNAYYHAEAHRNFIFRPDRSAVKHGNQLGDIDAIGLYVQNLGVDGTSLEKLGSATSIKNFRVTVE